MLFPTAFRSFLAGVFALGTLAAVAQQDLPTDYLTPAFHKGRRDAARALMPDSSVMVVFAAPTRTFSNDVDYVFHQNPDLYYFTGYKEPNAVLLIYKEMQTAADGRRYNEVFFAQKKDPRQEQWTGRRLGAEGVKQKLGIAYSLTSADFKNFPWKNSGIKTVLFELPEEISNDNNNSTDLFAIVQEFRKTTALPAAYNATAYSDLNWFAQGVSPASLTDALGYFKNRAQGNEAYNSLDEVKEVLAINDSNDLKRVQQNLLRNPLVNNPYYAITARLREVKTPEEMYLLRRAVEISCAGHNEAMKTLHPEMSELEIQGLQEYIHKKYGAEEVGYGSIVGAGENGCILHYMENSRTRIGTNLLLMDVGASYHGYSADVTRTIPAQGKFSADERSIYQLVYDAQEAAFKTLKEGSKWADANKAANEVISNGLLRLGIIKDKKDFRKYYPHGLGHHIGLDVHDRSEYGPLKKDMVITIEPGIYIPPNSNCDKKWWGIAVRIEDDALITENGYELLSAFSPRSIADIEKMMAEKSVIDNFKLSPLKTQQKRIGF